MSGTEVVLLDLYDRNGVQVALVVNHDSKAVMGAWLEERANNTSNATVSGFNLYGMVQPFCKNV